ncbi:MAG: hypothetical protein Q7R45_13725, partial [Sulfuricaulis sp.]|nr:hypothetical protein [Sulfuricaulis sp.]
QGFPGYYNEPTAGEDNTIVKLGFDLTAAYGKPDTLETRRPRVPQMKQAPRCASVREALQAGPRYFLQIMEALGSSDGREVALALETLREQGALDRDTEGRYFLLGKEHGLQAAGNQA